MATMTPPALITAEEFLKLPDRDRFELVDGELVEQDVTFWSSYVSGNVLWHLQAYARANKAGWVAPDNTTYQCYPGRPNQVRKPDASFIRLERLSLARATTEGHMTVAPDLAVEVLFPNDLAADVATKVQEYLDAGVSLVWVIQPTTRTVAIHRAQGPGTKLRENDILDGEDVLPGFRCRVGDLFLPPPGCPAS